MIQINHNADEYELKIDINSDLGKKILNLINKNKAANLIKIKFNSSKSYNPKKFEKMIGTEIVELSNNFNIPVIVIPV